MEKKKVTIAQIDRLIEKAKKNCYKDDAYLAYLIDFKGKYIQALNEGTTPPSGPKKPPGAGH